jgi:prepilin-type processing-associated H-X9-DG protein
MQCRANCHSQGFSLSSVNDPLNERFIRCKMPRASAGAEAGLSFFREISDATFEEVGVHADRVVSGDCHHRHSDRLARPRGAKGSLRSCADAVHEQSQQLGLALQSYHDTWRQFPVGEFNDDNRNWGWGAAILANIDQGPLLDALTASMNSGAAPANSGGQYFWVPQPGGGGNNTVWGSSYNMDNANNYGVVNTNAGNGAAKTSLAVYQCPSDLWPAYTSAGFGKSNYLACMGSDTSGGNWASWNNPNGGTQNGCLLQSNDNSNTWTVKINQITDGTSNTVLLGEVTANSSPSNFYSASATNTFPIWAGGNPNQQGMGAQHNYFRVMDQAYPLNLKTTANADRCFGSQHEGGANFLFCDGTVHFITNSISGTTYQYLATRAAGEVVDSSAFN